MRKFAAVVVIALALTGCAAGEPEARSAPFGATNVPSASADAEPTAPPSAEPEESAYPDADEDAFLELVHRDWQGAGMPNDEALVAAGYDRCAATADVRVEHQDDFWPEWSGPNNMMVGFAAEYFLCPGPA